MNRKQFAQTVAQAYIDQYHWQTWRRRPVMNNPAIDYDITREMFGSCSTLTPTATDEVRVLELEDGMFGSDGRITKRDIVAFLMQDNELWREAQQAIEAFRSEYAEQE